MGTGAVQRAPSASSPPGRAEWCCGKSLGLEVEDWLPGPAVTLTQHQLWALGCSNFTESVSSSVM